MKNKLYINVTKDRACQDLHRDESIQIYVMRTTKHSNIL